MQDCTILTVELALGQSSGDLNQPLIQSMINKTIVVGESFEFERDGADEGTSLWRSIDGDAGLTHLENYGSETISLKEFKSLCSNLPLFSGKYSGSALRRQKTSFLRGRCKSHVVHDNLFTIG